MWTINFVTSDMRGRGVAMESDKDLHEEGRDEQIGFLKERPFLMTPFLSKLSSLYTEVYFDL